jgi:hypothetical protein
MVGRMKILEMIIGHSGPTVKYEITSFKSQTTNNHNIAEGYVHTLPDFGAALLTKNFMPYLIPPKLVNQHNLQMGDYISARCDYYEAFVRYEVVEITKIHPKKTFFDNQEGIKSNGEQGITIGMKRQSNEYPIEKVTNYIKETKAYKIAVLVDGKVEHVEYLKNIGFAEGYFSPAGKSAAYKILNMLYALFRAKELAVDGENVILMADFTKIFTAFNMTTWIETHVDPNTVSAIAVADCMNCISCAKCLKNGGSLTIIGTVNEEIYPTIAQQIKDVCDKFID